MDILDELMVDAQAEAPVPPPVVVPIRKLRYTHDAMVDMIISDPSISQNALAARFGYTASWISQVIASDAFQARLAERSNALVDPIIRHTVEERFKGIVLRSLEILAEKLNGPSSAVTDGLALRALDIASRAAGYGAKVEQVGTGTKVDVNIHLENLGENLTKLLTRKRSEAALPLEGEFRESNTAKNS